ncbi:MAG: cytoplasmic protein [Candidatus Magnetoglobus multicellularis str. Araruama]|uniref:Cytoplasmic protein n=1 Tax=Candidatus Magnetoglobus multicellularis str. Araruama TaxID=890399 RepID=A0A1V1P2M0_9BACT|nr:MAG: cytoplasmic protein [Candidatus Magnetoglobus multicellularis str. Araruama]
MPIWIGILEATPLAASIQEIQYDRPMTHDLFKQFMNFMQMRIQKIEISDIVDNTYHATIFFSSQDYVFSLDARPSDAITMALKFKAPIYASDTVLQESLPQKAFTYSNNQQEIIDKSKDGEKWLNYLQSLSVDDFNEYPV